MNEEKFVIFLRVSTLHQEYESQLMELREYAKSKGFHGEPLVIAEKESAISLEENEREGLNRLKDAILNDGYRTVFVSEISRLGRDEVTLFSVRDKLLIKNKVQLYIKFRDYRLFDDDGTVNENASLLFTLYAHFATQEMKQKKERFARSRELKRQEGKRSSGALLYGYTTDKDKNIIVNVEEADIIRRIIDEYVNTDITLYALGDKLVKDGVIPVRKPSHTIQWVKDRVTDYQYCGILRKTSWIKNKQTKKMEEVNAIHPHVYPAILPKELVDKAIEKTKRFRMLPKEQTTKYLCKGILKYKASDGKYYTLSGSKSTGRYTIERPDFFSIICYCCDSLAWHYTKQLYPLYLAADTTKANDEMNEKFQQLERRAKFYISQIEEYNKKIERINNIYINGRISEEKYNTDYQEFMDGIEHYNKQLDILSNEQKQLELQAQSLTPHIPPCMSSSVKVNVVPETMKEYISKSIDRIICYKTDGYIHLDIYGFNKLLYIKTRFKKKTTQFEWYDMKNQKYKPIKNVEILKGLYN